MPLNPQVANLLQQLAAFPAPDFATESPAEIRAKADVPMQFGEPPAVARVEDVQIALAGSTLAARLYIPHDAGDMPPLTVFYHGGGWVIGTLETHDSTCRALARDSGSAVLSVAYRLAPEHPYPVPVEDAYDALAWAAEHAAELGVDSARLAVAGDSAGGNLAAAVAIVARDRDGPRLRHQLLIYPVTDMDFDRHS
ncbi:MAG: alpha/beta hydrolase, partial [Erythrobacter sp.]|nr:alpha/beta hydrolase [Erythrobacter sp.]